MACFGRVHKKRRRTGGGKRCRNLVADVPGFAHTADDDAAGCFEAQLAGGYKILVEPCTQGFDGTSFYREYVAGECEQFVVRWLVRQWRTPG